MSGGERMRFLWKIQRCGLIFPLHFISTEVLNEISKMQTEKQLVILLPRRILERLLVTEPRLTEWSLEVQVDHWGPGA